MKRTRTLLITLAVALLAAGLPLLLLGWLSWQQAMRLEHRDLQRTAERALRRADLAYVQALQALKSLPLPPDAGPVACSPAHIGLMQSKVVTTSSVDQIGYFQNGLMRCNSWGPVTTEVRFGEPDHITADGVDLRLDLAPRASYGRRMLSMRYGDYDALMDPGHFVDLIDDPDVRVAIATPDGRLIATQGAHDPQLLQSLLRDPHDGSDARSLFATARNEEWLAIATAPRSMLRTIFMQQLWVLLPVSILVALASAAAAVWLSRRRTSMAAELGKALRRGELYVVYQPLIELETGACIGAEALVRWQRRDGSHVRPDVFIPVAEESELILKITDHVIDSVIADLRELMLEDRDVHIAINLAPDDMMSGRALKVLASKLAGTGIANNQIWLEATERGFMDIERSRAVITAARHAGHRVAIDDFGIGYSNLQYLQQLPLDALKIDKAFIDAIGTGSATSPVTAHIIEMARTLGLQVVAEGVETEAQLAFLHAHGVDYGQGWLFSKALPREAFIAFHRERRTHYRPARQRSTVEPANPEDRH